MINLQLLKRICETPGAPGFEQRIRQLVIKEVQGLVDELSVDNMGNVVAIKRGKERKRAADNADQIARLQAQLAKLRG